VRLIEFIEAHRNSGESILSLADMAVNVGIEDDAEFMMAAKAALVAEDKFYKLWLARKDGNQNGKANNETRRNP
jgi:hypothetical protein